MSRYSNEKVKTYESAAKEELASLKDKVSLSKKDEEALKVLRTLSDPTKLKIYVVLKEVEELSVGDLAEILELSQSAVSHALSDLKLLGLVECRRCGQYKCYFLTHAEQKSTFNRFLDWLKS